MATVGLLSLLVIPFLIGVMWLPLIAVLMLLGKLSMLALNYVLLPVLVAVKKALPFGLGYLLSTMACLVICGIMAILVFVFVFLPVWWFVITAVTGEVH